MEFLDKIGDFLNSITSLVEGIVRKVFGSSNEREIQRIGFVRDKAGNDVARAGSALERISQLEPELEKLSEGELKATADTLRAKLADGKTLDDLLPEAFAAVREASKRYLHMRHYDVQMVGGYILHQGKISEMVTGEGKTLVSTLPAFLNGVAGHVHVVTVNDYLAQRDMEWMAPVHLGLGLTISAIQANMDFPDKVAAYGSDITYGTNNEFGFDYLRDNMAPVTERQVQGPLDFAIVDEIDNILIDEARTPLIISGKAHDDITKYPKADRIARQLKKDVDFEVREKEHTCHMTDDGIRRAEELAGVESFYTAGNMEWPHLIDNSLKAHHLYKNDVTYVVENGEVVIVDEHTGRKMHGRQWSDGLHQAVEAKEGVTIKETTQTLATITLQNFFKLYGKLCGMTGTAMTEANEFVKIYGLDVVAVPTNRPMKRVNYSDVIYRSENEKWNAVIEEIRDVHKSGRPILVGTVSIEKSELVSNKLSKFGIEHKTLNAKFHEREAEFVAQAGRLGAVTIATNMAGRGTDIVLGGNPEHMAWDELKLKKGYESRLEVPKSEWEAASDEVAEREGMKAEGRTVAESGGLHVIGTERHDARRIDLQLRGRSGRQGDPGSSRFFLSLDDDLMRIFAGDWVRTILTRLGMEEGEAIESGMVSKQIEKAQKRVEERHFESRKNLLEYDEVMDYQRKEVYAYRQRILDGANCRELILDMIDRQVDKQTDHFLSNRYHWETCATWASQMMGIEVEWDQLRDMKQDQMVVYLTDEAHRQAEDLIQEQLDENLPEDVDQRDWNWQTLAQWANRQFGINTNDRELKKLGLDDVSEGDLNRTALYEYLNGRAKEAITRIDFSELATIHGDDFNVRTLSGWLKHQYNLDIDPQELAGFDDTIRPKELIGEQLRKQYREQEIKFPVAVGMTRFLGGGGQSDREGLIRWANGRFQSSLTSDDFKEKERPEIENLLTERSRSFFPPVEAVNKLEDQFAPHESSVEGSNGQPDENGSVDVRGLVDFANKEFHVDIKPDVVADLGSEDAYREVLQRYDARYRPELGHAERAVLLDVLDHAWKEHLYYMDHLRQGIGLVGYAQKDPKVEYKREGMKAFEVMWDSIGERVTGAIFRLEKESPQFVSSLWQITGTVHEEAAPASEAYVDDAQPQGQQPGGEVQTVDPIRNRDVKVGRNDPCPCGSGKKYKKCHGANS